MRINIISSEKSTFLKFELENANERRKKGTLQEICRLYRSGYKFSSEWRNGFEITINGLVLSCQDEKVIRWCLNALSQLGTLNGSNPYVEEALKKYYDVPEIIAAAISALARFYNGDLSLVQSLKNVDPKISTLAALQNTDPSKLNLNGFSINIDNADTDVLKLALITVGLNRDIENLFDPKHSNGQIVKALGQHPDPIVRQYCVWSVLENVKLSLSDLGIPFDELGKQPANVQSKLLQLAAERENDVKRKHSIIHEGSFINSLIAREGLAKGLLRCFYDGLEDITINWFDTEKENRVKLLLAEHFALYSDVSSPYAEKAMEIAEMGDSYQKCILLGAEGKPLFAQIKGSSIVDGTPDLFGGDNKLVSLLKLNAASPTHRKSTKVLILAASPEGANRVRFDKEISNVEAQLALVKSPKVTVKIRTKLAVRTNEIQSHILNETPSILHFSGNGTDGLIWFENDASSSGEVTGDSFADLIRLMPPIQCVVLNSCHSTGIAKLISQHVGIVVGCDKNIGEDAAISFSCAFYRAIAHGYNFEKSFYTAKNEVELTVSSKEADGYYLFVGSGQEV